VKHRVRLTEEDIARLWPPKHRERLPPDFNLEAYKERKAKKLAKFRLGNIPNFDECKYIYGELRDPKARYCGDPVLPGKSWCEKHHKLCTRVLASPEKVYRSKRRR